MRSPTGLNFQMSICARNAGMIKENIPNHLMIVYEPDAASLSVTESNVKDLSFKDNDRYIVLDLGGGTADIACHEIINSNIKNFKTKEIHPPTGGDWGSFKIDNLFLLLIECIMEETYQQLMGTNALLFNIKLTLNRNLNSNSVYMLN